VVVWFASGGNDGREVMMIFSCGIHGIEMAVV
jgi:hypothetical protein